MANGKKVLADVADILAIKLDESKMSAKGLHRGYTLLAQAGNDGKNVYISVSLCASFAGAPIQQVLTHEVKVPEKVVCSSAGYRINLKCIISGKHEKNVDRVVEAVRALVNYVITNEGVNCDEKGFRGDVDIWCVQGNYIFLCPESAEGLNYNMNQASAAYKSIQENYVLGIIGALLGSVVGAAVILLVARMGYVSAISSAVMGFAVVFGYKKLGKKFSVFGGILCIVISIAMTYLAFRIDSTWDLFNAFQDAGWDDMTFKECFEDTKEWYEELDAMADYTRNMILMVLSGVVGAIAAVWVELKERKTEFSMKKFS
jgi:hypothetical protein